MSKKVFLLGNLARKIDYFTNCSKIDYSQVTEKVSWRQFRKQLNLENLCYEGKYRQFVVRFKKNQFN
jgi:hypothetical protein